MNEKKMMIGVDMWYIGDYRPSLDMLFKVIDEISLKFMKEHDALVTKSTHDDGETAHAEIWFTLSDDDRE